MLINRFLKEIVTRLTANIDGPEVVQMLQAILKEQLKDIDLSTPLGNWLKKSIENGDHNQLWDMILNAAKKTIHDNATRKTLLKLVEKQIRAYKDEDFLKGIFVGAAGKVGIINANLIVDKISSLHYVSSDDLHDLKNTDDDHLSVKNKIVENDNLRHIDIQKMKKSQYYYNKPKVNEINEYFFNE